MVKDGSQRPLFDSGEWWEDEWQGMPEFAHEDLSPHRSIIVHFNCKEDALDFFALVGQSYSPDIRSIWFPVAEIGRIADKRYIDSEDQE